MNLRKGQIIRFRAMDDMTGNEVELSGTIVGDWAKIKKNYPEEIGGVDENSEVFLVDALHYSERFIVYREEILKTLGKENEKENNPRL